MAGNHDSMITLLKIKSPTKELAITFDTIPKTGKKINSELGNLIGYDQRQHQCCLNKKNKTQNKTTAILSQQIRNIYKTKIVKAALMLSQQKKRNLK